MVSIITASQYTKALEWYMNHATHVTKLVNSIRDKDMYPPSREDINQPMLWKAEHWKWYLSIK